MNFHLGKPILVMLIIAVISGGFIASYRTPPRKDLVMWTFAAAHAETYRSIVDDFQKQTGLGVNFEHIGLRAETVRLESMFLSGQSGEILPDVVEMEIGNIGKFFLPPVDEIGFEPLNDYLKAEGWDKRIVESRLATWSKDGIVFGVPHDVHPVTITYRKDLFDEAGVDLESATTWEDFQNKCLEFQAYWQKQGYPLRHAMDLKQAASDHVIIMLLQRGINVVDEGEHVRLNEPIVAQTVAEYASMIAGPRRIGWEGSANNGIWIGDLVAGNLCAFFTADWRVFDVVTYAPQLAGKLRMMALPKFDPADAPTSTWGGTMIGITRRSRNKDAAWKLIKFLYLSPEGLEARLKKTNILPPVKEMWDHPYYHQADPFFGGQKINELYVKLASQIPARHASPVAIMAQIQLSVVVDWAGKYVQEHGTEGLEAACQRWLDESAEDVKVAAENARFEQ